MTMRNIAIYLMKDIPITLFTLAANYTKLLADIHHSRLTARTYKYSTTS